MATAEYLIPSTSDGTVELEAEASVSSTVSSVVSSKTCRIVGASTGLCNLRVEKALTENGPFFSYTSQTLDDSDIDYWIKLDAGLYPYFRLTATNQETTEEIQVKFFIYLDDAYKYCDPIDVRNLCGLSYDDITDTYLMNCIDSAVVQLNADISELVVEERILGIDQRRLNIIDGSNTTFYIDIEDNKYFGDLDDSGEIDTDDITVYEYTSDRLQKILMTVSSFTTTGVDKGKFVLSIAPSTSSYLTVTYRKQRLPVTNALIKEACTYLSASIALTRIDPNEFSSVQIGGLKAVMGSAKRKGRQFLDKYAELIRRIDTTTLTPAEQPSEYKPIDYPQVT